MEGHLHPITSAVPRVPPAIAKLVAFSASPRITRLVIAGSMTHMCIDATTRAAKDLGYRNVVIGDACATRDLQYGGQMVPAPMVQAAFLAALHGTYADVMTAEEWLAR